MNKDVYFVSNDLISSVIEEKGLLKHRRDILKFIHELPTAKPTDDINNWINNVNSNFDLGINLKNIKDTRFQGYLRIFN